MVIYDLILTCKNKSLDIKMLMMIQTTLSIIELNLLSIIYI
jgi:hypothetical protein